MNYEHLLALIQSRRSVRRFSDQPVSREDLLRLFEAARWAPSNHNRQPWRFLVLEERAEITRLAEQVGSSLSERLGALPVQASSYAAELMHYATFFVRAPVILAALHKRPVSVSNALLAGVKEPSLVSGEPLSAAMAVQNVLLAAHTLGLGTCVLTAPLIAQEAVLKELQLPAGHDLTCLIALGHPIELPPAPRRKSIEQIVEFRKDTHQSESTK